MRFDCCVGKAQTVYVLRPMHAECWAVVEAAVTADIWSKEVWVKCQGIDGRWSSTVRDVDPHTQ